MVVAQPGGPGAVRRALLVLACAQAKNFGASEVIRMNVIRFLLTGALFTASLAQAGMPVMPEIPTTLPDSIRQSLIAKRQPLALRKLALIEEGKAINQNCASVEEGSSQHQSCLARQKQFNDKVQVLKIEMGELADEIAAAVNCNEIERQLARDQEAMHRQQKSIEQGQAELMDWTKKNDDAQKAALKRATSFLVDALAGKLGEFTEGKLAKLEANFKKRAPLGETWQRKIQKVQEFRATEARLTGAVDGIKLAGFTGAAADGWREGKEWAAKNGKDAETLDAILADWQRDPEIRQIMKESGISTFSAGLGLSETLAPWGTALDFGQFLVGYGYDATGWTLSKNRIEQQIANRDQDLKAVEALKKQIERTVANLKACR